MMETKNTPLNTTMHVRKLDPRPATDVYAYKNSVCIKQMSLENEQRVEQLVYFDIADIPVIVKWMVEVAEEIKKQENQA